VQNINSLSAKCYLGVLELLKSQGTGRVNQDDEYRYRYSINLLEGNDFVVDCVSTSSLVVDFTSCCCLFWVMMMTKPMLRALSPTKILLERARKASGLPVQVLVDLGTMNKTRDIIGSHMTRRVCRYSKSSRLVLY